MVVEKFIFIALMNFLINNVPKFKKWIDLVKLHHV